MIKKKISELTKSEQMNVCTKAPTCSKCPLLIEAMARDEAWTCYWADIKSYKKVNAHKDEYEKFGDKEIEVEENGR